MDKTILIYNAPGELPLSSATLKEQGWTCSSDRSLLTEADVVLFHLPTLADSMPDELTRDEHQLWVSWKYKSEQTGLWLNPEIEGFFDLFIIYTPALLRKNLYRSEKENNQAATLSLLYGIGLINDSTAPETEEILSIPYSVSLFCFINDRVNLWKKYPAHIRYHLCSKTGKIVNTLKDARRFPSRRKVDFMLIGTQKGGTTSLHEYLCQHPGCLGSRLKEPMFFLYPCVYSLGMPWYKKLWLYPQAFPKRPSNCLLFESSTWYSYWYEVPGKLFKYNPALKFIFLLRNPIERAFSQYNMLIRRDKKQLLYEYHLFNEEYNVEEFVDQLLDISAYPFAYWARLEMERFSGGENTPSHLLPDFLHRGIYCTQLERYYEYFPKEQILILESNDLKKKRTETLCRIENFLKIPHIDWNALDIEEKHVSRYFSPFPKEIRKELQSFYAPYNRKIYEMTGQDFNWT